MKTILSCLLLIIYTSAHAQSASAEEKVIMTVYFYWGDEGEIWYVYGMNQIEKHSMPDRKEAEKKIEEKSLATKIYMLQVMTETFNNLYKAGWRLIVRDEKESCYYFER